MNITNLASIDKSADYQNKRVCQVKCVSSFLHLFPQLSAV